MIQAGVLTEDDPVELLEGWIVFKMPRNPPHDSTIDRGGDVLRQRLPQGWYLRVQNAVTIDESEPEPDLAIVSGTPGDYFSRHPGAPDIALLVEVADSTLNRDREKGRLYARARVPVYWIINLIDSRVEVYTDPSGPATSPSYRRHLDFGINEVVPLTVAGHRVDIPVRDFFP
jgi:Uma2 family endonuclease